MVHIVEMTYQEKYGMYISLKKEILVKMLIECNNHLDRFREPSKYLFCGAEKPL